MQPEKCSPSYTQDPFTIETALFIYDYEKPKETARAIVEKFEKS